MYFENMKVPKENLLGNKGRGFEVLLYRIAIEKVQQCAANVGIAQAGLDETVKYAKSRIVKGRSLTTIQGVRWALADMQSKIDASR